jgi:hypothetical protein
MQTRWVTLFLACCFTTVCCPAWSVTAEEVAATLQTVAESSDFTATATYDEVMSMCRELAQTRSVCLSSMGQTFEERDLPLLILSNAKVTKPSDLTGSNKLVVFAMGNIHAGEVCGKEALLMLARELSVPPSPLLEQVVVLLAPIYNADGNECFSVNNRRNQVGPARGMGQRTNAQDLDLNRDNVKHESPESRALARLITDWKPAICIDTHTTNGSHHRYTITYDGPRHPATPGGIVEYTRDKFLPAVDKQLSASGYESFFYGNFNKAHDRWDTYPDLPRYCTHYFGLRGTIGVLSEAYAYASYKDRVLATRDFVKGCLECAVAQADAIRQLLIDAERADREATTFPIVSTPVALGEFEILGYDEREQNGKSIRTDEHRVYPLTYYGLSRPTKTVRRPFGYLVPGEATKVIDTLVSHNIQICRLVRDTELDIEYYSIVEAELADREIQGHRPMEVKSTTTSRVQKTMPMGTVIVPAHQPMLGGLIANLLEPAAADGLCAWNFFDKQLVDGNHASADQPFPIVRVHNDVSDSLEPRPSPSGFSQPSP